MQRKGHILWLLSKKHFKQNVKYLGVQVNYLGYVCMGENKKVLCIFLKLVFLNVLKVVIILSLMSLSLDGSLYFVTLEV